MDPRYSQLDVAVLKRIVAVNLVLIEWMKHENITETTPEECNQKFVELDIYPQQRNAVLFRKDLRYLRDHNALDIFHDIRVYQTINRRWHIELQLGNDGLRKSDKKL